MVRYTLMRDDQYLRTMWALMIAYGGAAAHPAHPVDYYGNCANIDFERSRQVAERLADGETPIWYRMTDPSEQAGSGFAGAECDYDSQVHVLTGLLEFESESVPWVAVVPAMVGFGGLVRLLTGAPLTLDGALNKLYARVTAEGAEDYFRYGCRISDAG